MLEIRSHFSFGRGCHSLDELAEGLLSAGWDHLPLCDIRGLYGMVELKRACEAEGRSALKPILGASFPAMGGALVFARNAEGLKELNRLLSLDQLGPGWEARPPEGWAERDLPFENEQPRDGRGLRRTGAEADALRQVMLQLKHCELILPGTQALDALLPMGSSSPRPDGDRLSIGLDPLKGRREANELWQRARELQLPVCPHRCVEYMSAGERALHLRVQAIHQNRSIEELARLPLPDRSLPGRAEVERSFERLPEALRRQRELVDRCGLELETGRFHLPTLPGTLPGSEGATLRRLCEAGLKRRFPAPGPWRRRGQTGRAGTTGTSSIEDARRRLAEELAVIERLGFSGYFLVVREIVEHVRSRNMPMIGRGSAANSLVAYCLGFTEVDPIRHRLSFERFLNPWRSTPPDIDLDFSWTDRDEVFRHVFRRFGADHVAMLSTTVTLGPRGALRELAKAEGLSGAELDALSRTFPRGRHDWEEEISQHPARYGLQPDAEPLRSLLPWVKRLCGLPRHLGIHVGGILITPGPITDYLPLERAGRGITVSQLDMHPVEELGLLKIDLLAQRGLGDYKELLRLERIEARAAREGGPPAPPRCPESVYELEVEPATATLLREGRSMGCFYVESPGMQSLLRKLKPDSFEDLIAASSIIRPGVSESGMMQAYIERHRTVASLPHGEEWPIDFLHPLLRELLEDTYGVMVYQEDVMHVASGLAGMSLSEGDLLRRAMSGKGATPATLRAMQGRFLSGCAEHQVPEAVAEEIWRQIASFAGYAFCKAHSASFAVLSYRMAWYKAHRPGPFMAAVLNNGGGFFSPAAYVQEARRIGLKLRQPCIMRGNDSWQAEGQELRAGLRAISGLSRGGRLRLAAERARRPWRSFNDLRERSGLSREELEQLVFSGACDRLAGNKDPRILRPALLWQLKGQTSLDRKRRNLALDLDFGQEISQSSAGQWSWIDCWRHERQALGFGLCRHPLELFDFGDLQKTCTPSCRLSDCEGQRVRMIGWKFAMKPIRTRNERRRMAFLSLEDLDGTWEAVLFPDVWERYAMTLRQSGPFLLEGRVEFEAEEAMLQVEHMELTGRLSERMARLAV
jgi:DNA-directed DNA polymerase III PolC